MGSQDWAQILLGKKSTPLVMKMSQANGQQKEYIQDLGIYASNTGCSIGFLASMIYSSLQGCYNLFKIRNLGLLSREVRPMVFKKLYSDKKSHRTPCI